MTVGLALTILREEDLGLYGDQLNYMQTLWTVGYVIGQLPSTSTCLVPLQSTWV